MTSTDLLYVQPFTASAALEVSSSGGKGATLARLFQAALPVPPGCVLTTQALTAYMRQLSLTPTSSPEEVRRQILAGEPPTAMRQALRTVLQQFTPAPMGWAVRSSAVAEDSVSASFAGVYESMLEVSEPEA